MRVKITTKISLKLSQILILGLALILSWFYFGRLQVRATSAESKVGSKRLVTIYDRGRKRVVMTNGQTVAAVLEQAKIKLIGADRVEPGLEQELNSDNFNINIFRAQPLVIIDGQKRYSGQSAQPDPRRAVESNGIKLFPEDVVELKLDLLANQAKHLNYHIRRAKLVKMLYYGQAMELRTQASTVADFLTEKKIVVSASDHLSLDVKTPIRNAMNLELWREGKQELSIEEEVKFKVRSVLDFNRERNYHQIEQPGQVGKKLVTYEVEMKNGQEVGRRPINSLLLKEAVEQVEVRGAKGRYTNPSHNENAIWEFLLQQGFSRVQAAGIMGNLMQEHRFQTNDAPGGLGIVQWIGGRRRELIKRYPHSWTSLAAQLDFLMYELNTKYAHVKREIMATNDLKTAVDVFQNKFEKCGICRNEKRLKYAADILASH